MYVEIMIKIVLPAMAGLCQSVFTIMLHCQCARLMGPRYRLATSEGGALRLRHVSESRYSMSFRRF
jgi:hypothetical protein